MKMAVMMKFGGKKSAKAINSTMRVFRDLLQKLVIMDEYINCRLLTITSCQGRLLAISYYN